jgi:SAM-dependent methyltransferase
MNESMMIFDRRAVRAHRSRAAGRLGGVASVIDDLAQRLLSRLDDTTMSFTQALDIGGRGIVAPILAQRHIDVVSIDLSPAMVQRSGGHAVTADEECLPFAPASFDLIVAHLALHWVNDLPGALLQLRQSLKPGGLFLASMPVLGTLASLRSTLLATEEALTGRAAPRISPFPDLRDCASLLQRAGFALPVVELEDIALSYANPLKLLRDLQAAGENNAIAKRSRAIPPRSLFPATLAALPRTDNRVTAELRMAILTGWAP